MQQMSKNSRVDREDSLVFTHEPHTFVLTNQACAVMLWGLKKKKNNNETHANHWIQQITNIYLDLRNKLQLKKTSDKFPLTQWKVLAAYLVCTCRRQEDIWWLVDKDPVQTLGWGQGWDTTGDTDILPAPSTGMKEHDQQSGLKPSALFYISFHIPPSWQEKCIQCPPLLLHLSFQRDTGTG